MYTHNKIIGLMTEAQKIRLLTDLKGFAAGELSALGLTQFNTVNLSECKSFPTEDFLARSWSTELVSEVSASACRELAANGAGQVILPSARGGIGKTNGSLSEDSHLSASLSASFMEGAARAGVGAMVEGYGIEGSKYESYICDTPVSQRSVAEHLVSPFRKALVAGGSKVVIAEDSSVDIAAFEGLGVTVVRRQVSREETAAAINRGELFLSGSAEELQRALHTYRQIRSRIEHGKASAAELEEAIAAGDAVSEETLDGMVDKALGIICACTEKKITPQVTDKKTLVKNAFAASSVLLENRNKLLPLRKGCRLCCIGDIANNCGNSAASLEAVFTAVGYTYTGYARGYDIDKDRSEELLAPACELAKKSDVVILFLSTDLSVSRNVIPANQLALCKQLDDCGKKVVMVISSDGTPDLGFLSRLKHPAEAVLLCPLAMSGGTVNALRLLLGELAPEGRLCKTYADKESFAADRNGYRVGPFVGYRYYDTLGYGAVYPFGYGLTYTSFSYSGLSVSGGEVSFTVKNNGKRRGTEIAQVYLGMEGSAVLRPKKELAAYARIELEAGEKRRVTLSLEAQVYDTERGAFETETGKYTVYVGASVDDIRLKKSIRINGSVLLSDGADKSDYLSSETNIFKEHYTLEAEYKPMKSSIRNLIAGIVALVLAIAVTVYNLMTLSHSPVLYIIAAVLAVGAIIFFIVNLADRKKKFKADRAAMEEASSMMFADADKINVPSAEELFAAVPEIEDDEVAADSNSEKEREYDHFGDVDKSLTFSVAATELARLASEKGITLSESAAMDIFTSLAASRLVVVKGMSDERFAALNALLAEYFGSPAGTQAVDAGYTSPTSILYSIAADGTLAYKNAQTVLNSAQKNISNIHMIALTGASLPAMSDYFSTFARYISAPAGGISIAVKDASGQQKNVRLPENIWFMLNLGQDEVYESIPDYIGETAMFLSLDIEVGVGDAVKLSEFKAFKYGQMIYLAQKAKAAFALDESVCKKIDRFEEFAARYSEFKMGNKMWLGLETAVGVLVGAGMEEMAALDKALALKVIPAAASALSGKLARDDRGVCETLEVIFGDDHTEECQKAVKNSGAAVA